jgi:hydrogenase maturation factor
MIVITDRNHADEVIELLTTHGEQAWMIGEVVTDEQQRTLIS